MVSSSVSLKMDCVQEQGFFIGTTEKYFKEIGSMAWKMVMGYGSLQKVINMKDNGCIIGNMVQDNFFTIRVLTKDSSKTF